MNGTSENGAKSSFWTFNLGHAITLAGMLFIAAAAWFNLGARITAVELLAQENKSSIARMDEHGTQASQKGIYQESEFSKSSERRLQMVEKFVADAMPKLERLDINVQFLKDQQSARLPKNATGLVTERVTPK